MSTGSPPLLDSHLFEGAQLTRGKGRDYVIFPEKHTVGNDENKKINFLQAEFFSWWGTTSFGSGRENLPCSTPDKKGAVIQLDKIWAQKNKGYYWNMFRQVAAIRNGEPKVQCILCRSTFQHPRATLQGSGSLGRHIRGKHAEMSSISSHPINTDQLVVDQSTIDQSAMDQTAMDQSAMDQSAMDQSAIDQSAMDQSVMDQPAIDQVISPAPHSPLHRPSSGHEITERVLMRDLLLFGLALNLPFDWTERPVTTRLFSQLGLHMELPGSNNLRNELNRLFEDVQSDVDKSLKAIDSKISIAIACWTSSNNLHFLAIVVYWIDRDWKFREAILDVPVIRGKATAEKIGKVVFDVLLEHRLHNRLLGVTSDNIANLVGAREALERHLRAKDIDWNARQFGVPCFAHVIKLAVNAFFRTLNIPESEDEKDDTTYISNVTDVSEIPGPANTISKIRIITGMIKSSSKRYARFIALQRDNHTQNASTIEKDTASQWMSTYSMLVQAHAKRNILAMWLAQEIQETKKLELREKYLRLEISDKEWYQVQLLINILKPLATLTDVILRTMESLIHRWFIFYDTIIDGLENQLTQLSDRLGTEQFCSDILSATQAAINKIREYCSQSKGPNGLIYNLATVLDPSNKLLLYRDWDTNESTRSENFLVAKRTEFMDFFGQHYQRVTNRSKHAHSLSSSSTLAGFRASHQAKRPTGNDITQPTQYLSGDVVDDDGGKLNPRDWWRRNEEQYPELALMARDVLTVAISNVGAERTFSCGKDYLSNRQSRLQSEIIRKALVVDHLLRGPTDARATNWSLNHVTDYSNVLPVKGEEESSVDNDHVWEEENSDELEPNDVQNHVRSDSIHNHVESTVPMESRKLDGEGLRRESEEAQQDHSNSPPLPGGFRKRKPCELITPETASRNKSRKC